MQFVNEVCGYKHVCIAKSILTPMNREQEERQAAGQLDVHDLHRVDGRHRERCRLLVLVVQLVEVLVQPRSVVQPVEDVGRVILEGKEFILKRDLKLFESKPTAPPTCLIISLSFFSRDQ